MCRRWFTRLRLGPQVETWDKRNNDDDGGNFEKHPKGESGWIVASHGDLLAGNGNVLVIRCWAIVIASIAIEVPKASAFVLNGRNSNGGKDYPDRGDPDASC
jgi:hypothetical protein